MGGGVEIDYRFLLVGWVDDLFGEGKEREVSSVQSYLMKDIHSYIAPEFIHSLILHFKCMHAENI